MRSPDAIREYQAPLPRIASGLRGGLLRLGLVTALLAKLR